VNLLALNDLQSRKSVMLESHLSPTDAVTALAFRPAIVKTKDTFELAVASEDSSLRIIQLDLSALS
jgi:hypothetical protein